MAYETITYDVADKIATITLNRPERLNAFTGQMMVDLIDAFSKADEDDDVRAVIVTGAGRGFCAGADLERGAGTFDNRVRGGAQDIEAHRDGGGLVTLRIFDMSKPVIAAMNGPAVGVGMTMTLPMDIRLAVPDAKMGFVFARRGLVPSARRGDQQGHRMGVHRTRLQIGGGARSRPDPLPRRAGPAPRQGERD